jgi:hypothetical protein
MEGFGSTRPVQVIRVPLQGMADHSAITQINSDTKLRAQLKNGRRTRLTAALEDAVVYQRNSSQGIGYFTHFASARSLMPRKSSFPVPSKGICSTSIKLSDEGMNRFGKPAA